MISNLLKRYWYFIVGALLMAGVVVGVNLFFGPQEIKKWSFGKKHVKECPPFGGFPVVVHNHLPPSFSEDLKKAVAEINLQVGKKLGMGDLFVLRGRRGSPSKTVANIYLSPAPKEWQASGKACEPVRLTESADTAMPELAHMSTRWDKKTGKLASAQIYVCVDKINKAIKLMAGSAAKKIKKLGRLGVLKHELMHAVIGPKHVMWGGSLMSESPDVTFVSAHTLTIIRRNVVAACRKNKRLSLTP